MPARAKRPPSPRSMRPSRPRRASAKRRRTRNGSKRQISHNSGAATRPATINCICNRGNTDSRNENVSRSMIRKSRNVSVSCRMPNLKCDSAIRITIEASDSAAQTPGRCSTTSRKQFTKTHASTRQRDRKRPVFGGQQNRQRRQMDGNDQAGQRKEPRRRAISRGCFRSIPGPATADISSLRAP